MPSFLVPALVPAPDELPRKTAAAHKDMRVPSARTQANQQRRMSGVLIKSKTAILFRHFPGALAGDEEAVHQLRVSGRRLRVALRLLAEKPDGRRATRAQRLLRTLTQTAGSGRDLDVLLEIFSERLKRVPQRSLEQNRLRRRLADARRRGQARMVQRLLDVEIAQLRGDLSTLALRGGPERSVVCARIRDLCERESRKLLDGFGALGTLLDIEALHALRRRARRLRYTVEIYVEIFGDRAGEAKPWKRLQDLIGVLHDHYVLAQWFDRQALTDEKRGSKILASAALAEADWARETMHQLHHRYLAEDPSTLVQRGLSAVGFHPTPISS